MLSYIMSQCELKLRRERQESSKAAIEEDDQESCSSSTLDNKDDPIMDVL